MAYLLKTQSLDGEGGKSKRICLLNDVCKKGDLIVSIGNSFKVIDDVELGDGFSGIIGKVEEDSIEASKKPVLVTVYDDTMRVSVTIANTETGEIVEADVQGAVLQTIVEEAIEDIEEDKSCPYRFLNYDGTVLQQGRVMKGTAPEYTGATPTKEKTAQYSYTFNGWSPTVGPIEVSTDYTAQYTETVNSYSIAFVYKGYDEFSPTGWIDKYHWETVEYGVTPSYTPPETYTGFEFIGWSPTPVPVTGDAMYIAQYQSIGLEIELTPSNYEGNVSGIPYLTVTNPGQYTDLTGATYNLSDENGICGASSMGFFDVYGNDKTTITYTSNTGMSQNLVHTRKLPNAYNGPYYAYFVATELAPVSGVAKKAIIAQDNYDPTQDSKTTDYMYVCETTEGEVFVCRDANPDIYSVYYKYFYVSDDEYDFLYGFTNDSRSRLVTYQEWLRLINDIGSQEYSKTFIENTGGYNYYGLNIVDYHTFEYVVTMQFKLKQSELDNQEWYILDTSDNILFDCITQDATLNACGRKFASVRTSGFDYFNSVQMNALYHLYDDSIISTADGSVVHNPLGHCITITDTVNSKTIVLQDRNNGAPNYVGESASPEDSYGYLYQWGNCGQFNNMGQPTTTPTQVDTTGYAPSQYYGYEFVTGNDDWSSPSNTNLWGVDTGLQTYQRGPCDEGRHVPTAQEWGEVYTLIVAITGNNSLTWGDIFNYLLVPLTPDISKAGINSESTTNNLYWCCTNSGISADVVGISGLTTTDKAYGLPIRAFKNNQLGFDEIDQALSQCATGPDAVSYLNGVNGSAYIIKDYCLIHGSDSQSSGIYVFVSGTTGILYECDTSTGVVHAEKTSYWATNWNSIDGWTYNITFDDIDLALCNIYVDKYAADYLNGIGGRGYNILYDKITTDGTFDGEYYKYSSSNFDYAVDTTSGYCISVYEDDMSRTGNKHFLAAIRSGYQYSGGLPWNITTSYTETPSGLTFSDISSQIVSLGSNYQGIANYLNGISDSWSVLQQYICEHGTNTYDNDYELTIGDLTYYCTHNNQIQISNQRDMWEVKNEYMYNSSQWQGYGD